MIRPKCSRALLVRPASRVQPRAQPLQKSKCATQREVTPAKHICVSVSVSDMVCDIVTQDVFVVVSLAAILASSSFLLARRLLKAPRHFIKDSSS